jgi:hypothetical protein
VDWQRLPIFHTDSCGIFRVAREVFFASHKASVLIISRVRVTETMFLLSLMFRITETNVVIISHASRHTDEMFLLSLMFRITRTNVLIISHVPHHKDKCSYYLTCFVSQRQMFLLSHMFRITGASFLFYLTCFASQRQCSHFLTFIGLGRPS